MNFSLERTEYAYQPSFNQPPSTIPNTQVGRQQPRRYSHGSQTQHSFQASTQQNPYEIAIMQQQPNQYTNSHQTRPILKGDFHLGEVRKHRRHQDFIRQIHEKIRMELPLCSKN
ncbi:hypothetical protein ACMFMG_000489 [Clarireedia jacksonii]